MNLPAQCSSVAEPNKCRYEAHCICIDNADVYELATKLEKAFKKRFGLLWKAVKERAAQWRQAND